MDRKQKLISAIFAKALILFDFFDDDESINHDEEYENILKILCLVKNTTAFRKPIPRLTNYVEEVIPAYNDEQFKSHFRYCFL